MLGLREEKSARDGPQVFGIEEVPGETEQIRAV